MSLRVPTWKKVVLESDKSNNLTHRLQYQSFECDSFSVKFVQNLVALVKMARALQRYTLEDFEAERDATCLQSTAEINVWSCVIRQRCQTQQLYTFSIVNLTWHCRVRALSFRRQRSLHYGARLATNQIVLHLKVKKRNAMRQTMERESYYCWKSF